MDAHSNNKIRIGEEYLIERYCVSRHHAKRLLAQYGNDKAEMDALLGAGGRPARHRAQDISQSVYQATFR
ncbi:MAG: hypothetical protein EOP84_33285 [Verrucomicrobiaceae bacterium]|nr:MAG: hypothetical protein EOP84_33285 [Verrucomicrobiaceae bacterium]